MRALLNPLFEQGNLCVGQFPARIFRRHLSTIISVKHSANQQTAFDISGRNGRTGFTTFLPALLCIQSKAALGLSVFGRMTLQTSLRQNRADLRFKKIFVGVC